MVTRSRLSGTAVMESSSYRLILTKTLSPSVRSGAETISRIVLSPWIHYGSRSLAKNMAACEYMEE